MEDGTAWKYLGRHLPFSPSKWSCKGPASSQVLRSGEFPGSKPGTATLPRDPLPSPGVAYTYSFTSDGATSPWGTFRLPPKRGVALKHLDYAIFSCANRGFGNFAAYSDAVATGQQWAT